MRDEFLDAGLTGDAGGCRRGRSAAAAARRVRRPAGAEGAPGDRHRGGQAARAGRRPPAVRRPARTRQDDAGRHRRRRDGRHPARHVGAGAGAGRRPGRHPDQAGGARRPVRRRDPPPVAGGRGDPLPGDGGLPARHRRRQGPGGVEHPPDPAAVHAGRGDDAHRHDHRTAARPLRARRPPRLLRHGGAGVDRRAGGRHPRRRPRRRPGRGRSPAARGARRASPTACCDGSATSPRCAATARSTPPRPAPGSPCSGSTTAGSTRSTGPSSARCASSSGAARSACRRWRSRSASRPRRSRTSTSRSSSSRASWPARPAGRVAMPAAYDHLGLTPPQARPTTPGLFD